MPQVSIENTGLCLLKKKITMIQEIKMISSSGDSVFRNAVTFCAFSPHSHYLYTLNLNKECEQIMKVNYWNKHNKGMLSFNLDNIKHIEVTLEGTHLIRFKDNKLKILEVNSWQLDSLD